MNPLTLASILFVATAVSQCTPGNSCIPAYFTDYNPCDFYLCDANSVCVKNGTYPDSFTCDLPTAPCRVAACVSGVCTDSGQDKAIDAICRQAPPNPNRDCNIGFCKSVSGSLTCSTSGGTIEREGETCNNFDNCTINAVCQGGLCVGAARDCFPYIQQFYQNGSLFVEECWMNTECKVISPSYAGDRCQELVQSSIPNCDAANLPADTLCLQPFNPQNPSPCDDGNNCTTSDQCGGGRCLSLLRNCSTDAELFSKFWIINEKDRACYDIFSPLAECRYLNGTCYLPFTEDRSICDDYSNTTNYDVCITGVCNSWYYEAASIWVYFNLFSESIVTFNSIYFQEIDSVGLRLATELGFNWTSTVKPIQIWPSENNFGAYARYEIFDLNTNSSATAKSFVNSAINSICNGLVEDITKSRKSRSDAPTEDLSASDDPFPPTRSKSTTQICSQTTSQTTSDSVRLVVSVLLLVGSILIIN